MSRHLALLPARTPRAYREDGFSLIELMIAITLGLLLLIGLSRLMAQQSSARSESERAGKQIENGRYAMTLLQDDIQLAGYFGQSSGPLGTLAAAPNPCETGSTTASVTAINAALVMPLQGYDSPTSGLSGCLADANHISGTDILVIRRVAADDPVATPTTTVSGRIYVQATPADYILGQGGPTAAGTFTLVQKDGTTPAEMRQFVEHIYFISPCNVPSSGTVCDSAADGGTPIPTLKRLELVDGAFITTPLVEGIENMQLDFGIDANSDGAPDSFITSPTVAQMSNIMAIKVNLLARTTDTSPGYVDSKTFALGLTSVGPLADAYKRHAYSVAVRAINISGRRE